MPHVAGHGRSRRPSRSQQRISKPKSLVPKPSSRQPGIGQSNTSKPKPKNTSQQKKDKGIMARKKAAQSMASQGILNLAGDVTANEKGRDSKFEQYNFDDRVNYNYNRKTKYADKNTKIKKDQITKTKAPFISKTRWGPTDTTKVTKDTNYKPSVLSKTRDIASKYLGIPAVFSQFGYSLMGGKKENVPFTKDIFNEKELSYIKDEALKTIKKKLNLRNIDLANLKNTKPVTVDYYAGNPIDVFSYNPFAERSVGSTLGESTVYINDDGELILTDYYDWKTNIDLTNPDTGEAPVNLEEWGYTVRKQSELYLFDLDFTSPNQDYMRPYKKDEALYSGYDPIFPYVTDKEQIRIEKAKEDAYNISSLFMDAAESLANIIGPEKYEQQNIFQVPEEKRIILNLGKI